MAFGIDNGDNVVGAAFSASTFPVSSNRAVLWPGGAGPLMDLTTGLGSPIWLLEFATAIAPTPVAGGAGTIAGVGLNSTTGLLHGFLLVAGVIVDLGPNVLPTAINDGGTWVGCVVSPMSVIPVAGTGLPACTMPAGGGFGPGCAPLPVPPAALMFPGGACATSINASGAIVGYGGSPGLHFFLSDGSQAHPPWEYIGGPYGVFGKPISPPGGAGPVPFFCASPVGPCTLLAAAGWSLGAPTKINSRGQVSGTGLDGTLAVGSVRGYLLSPAPPLAPSCTSGGCCRAATCTVSPAGSTGDGSCGAFLCNGTSGSCPMTCTTSANCVAGDACIGGRCVADTAPMASCASRSVTADALCHGTASVNSGSSDPDGDTLVCTSAPTSPYPLGATAVLLTCTDPGGLSGSCSATVTVADATPPTIICPAGVSAGTGPGSSACGVSGLALGTPITADNCSVASVTSTAPAFLPVGPNPVTWTALDGSGNPATCIQSVTVTDTTSPILVLPPDLTVEGNPPGAVVFYAATASDNCPTGLSPTCGPIASGGLFPIGATLITCSATDLAGNAVSGSFTVTVHNPCAGQLNYHPCNDHNACTRVDYCLNGACTGHTPVVCGARDQCHAVGSCDPATGLCSQPVAADGKPCDDGNACTIMDTCHGGACVGGPMRVCPALDDCHGVRCNAKTGACDATAKADGAYCGFKDKCANAHRCRAGVCAVAITPVKDGRSCSGGLCMGGFCIGTPPTL